MHLCSFDGFLFAVCFTSCFMSAAGCGKMPCRRSRRVPADVESVLAHHAADVPEQLKLLKAYVLVLILRWGGGCNHLLPVGPVTLWTHLRRGGACSYTCCGPPPQHGWRRTVMVKGASGCFRSGFPLMLKWALHERRHNRMNTAFIWLDHFPNRPL